MDPNNRESIARAEIGYRFPAEDIHVDLDGLPAGLVAVVGHDGSAQRFIPLTLMGHPMGGPPGGFITLPGAAKFIRSATAAAAPTSVHPPAGFRWADKFRPADNRCSQCTSANYGCDLKGPPHICPIRRGPVACTGWIEPVPAEPTPAERGK